MISSPTSASSIIASIFISKNHVMFIYLSVVDKGRLWSDLGLLQFGHLLECFLKWQAYQSKTLLGISFIFSHKMYNIWFCIISPFLILTFLGEIWFSLYLVGAICTLSLIYNHLSRSAFHIHSLIPFTFSPLFVPRPVIHFLLSLAQHGIVPHGPHVGPPA